MDFIALKQRLHAAELSWLVDVAGYSVVRVAPRHDAPSVSIIRFTIISAADISYNSMAVAGRNSCDKIFVTVANLCAYRDRSGVAAISKGVSFFLGRQN